MNTCSFKRIYIHNLENENISVQIYIALLLEPKFLKREKYEVVGYQKQRHSSFVELQADKTIPRNKTYLKLNNNFDYSRQGYH